MGGKGEGETGREGEEEGKDKKSGWEVKEAKEEEGKIRRTEKDRWGWKGQGRGEGNDNREKRRRKGERKRRREGGRRLKGPGDTIT